MVTYCFSYILCTRGPALTLAGMKRATKLDRLHYRVRTNRWLALFAVFNRVALAASFLPAGIVKIMGERFTDLAVNHPLDR